MFPGDEVDDQVSVRGPLYFSFVPYDPDGQRGRRIGRRGRQREIKKEGSSGSPGPCLLQPVIYNSPLEHSAEAQPPGQH